MTHAPHRFYDDGTIESIPKTFETATGSERPPAATPWDGLGPLTHFTGLHNYKIAFSDPAFVQAIEHTLILTGLALVIQGPLSPGIALLLNRKFRGRALMRLVVFARTCCRRPSRPSCGR